MVVYIMLNGTLPYNDLASIGRFQIDKDELFQKSSQIVKRILKSTLHSFPSARASLSELTVLAERWSNNA